MNIKLENLEKHHVENLLPHMQDGQEFVKSAMENNPNYANLMRSLGPCGAFIVNGQVLAIAGLIDWLGTNRATIWCVYAKNARKSFLALHRRMVKALSMFPRRRYEAQVYNKFTEGKRLVKAAGFEYEGLMRSYDGAGQDMELWAKVVV